MVEHDVKSPLTGAWLAVDTVSMNLEKRAAGNIVRTSADSPDAKYIGWATARLQILQQILRGEPEVHDPATVMRSLFSAILASSKAPGQAFLRVPAATDLPRIAMPASAFAVVFWNLLGNAQKNRAAERPLHVEVRLERREDSRILLSVTDNGQGIPEGKTGDLFEKGTRGGAPVAQMPAEHGLNRGIGLYVVDQLLRHFDGSISVDSQPGEWTTFFVALPVAAAGTPANPDDG
jgi:two-component system sensor histidine kinase KdpD